MLSEKKHIIELFNKNIRNKKIILDKSTYHNGKEGFWLEKQMNIKHNSRNEPDLYGFEMKKHSKKITFGDFSASEYLFSNKKPYINCINNSKFDINRKDFIKLFGNKNPLKNNRFSWSGSSFPKYNIWNYNGQIILLNDNNDILIFYSYVKDNRENKNEMPNYFKNHSIILIAYWNKIKIENHINKKFNINGFFICKKNNNVYDKICFGKKFNFDYFIDNFKKYNIILDSGMYDGNNRNYSHFRSSDTNFWNKLITEEY